jgi:hypothetical protein
MCGYDFREGQVSWPLRLRENLGLLIGSLARTESVGASVAVAGRPRREFRFSVQTGRAYAFDADGGLFWTRGVCWPSDRLSSEGIFRRRAFALIYGYGQRSDVKVQVLCHFMSTFERRSFQVKPE